MKKPRHKTRSIWIDIIFSSTIILLTVAAILLTLSPNKNQTASTPIEKEHPVVDSIETEVIDSNYPGIKIVTKTSNDKKAPFAIQYPQSTIDSFNERVLNYVTNVQEEYMETMKNKSLLDENTKGELNISYETLTHSSGNYSFVLVNNSNFSDSTKGTTEIRTFHLNPETGDSYSIADLLEGDIDRLRQLSAWVLAEIQTDEALTKHLHLEQLEQYTEPNWGNFQYYAVTDDSLIFYFDENTIADDSVGPIIISLSMNKSANLLLDTFKPKSVESSKDDSSLEKEEDSTTENTESEDAIEVEDSEESTETITDGKK